MRRQFWVWAAALVLLVGTAIYLGSPFLAVLQLKHALKSGDRDQLEQIADFPAIRENLKSQITAQMLARFRDDSNGGSGLAEGLALLFGPALIDRMVDASVTPEGLAVLIERGKMASQTGDAPASSSKPLSGAHVGYRNDLDTFAVSADSHDAPTLILKRYGFAGWKVKRIDLPVSMFKASTPTRALTQPEPPPDTPLPTPEASPLAPPPPEPAPESTPPNSMKAAANVAMRYLAAWSNPQDLDGESIRPFYAQVVTFYGRPVSVDDVMREKRAFARRWPIRSYILRPASLNAQCESLENCTVTGILDWRASNETTGRLSTGVASFNMHLHDGLIDQEGGRVLARQ